MASILLVEDETNARRVMSLGLQAKGHEVRDCDGPVQAMQQLSANEFDIVLTDLRMEGRDAGLEVVRQAVQLQPDAKVLLVTAYASADTAVAAMREGAFDYLTKPVSGEQLAMAVERALASREPAQQAPSSQQKTQDFVGDLIGSSLAMQRVRDRLARTAKRDFTVIVSGDSGTGKELAARYLHQMSARAEGPFVPVHCGAIPEGLFESELFGYRKGSFTGADRDHPGLIESASGGTLFLDEVGEMPLSIQVKLLRALQDHRVRRVGEDKERQIDVRLVAATNRDLAEEVALGHFREDLFYRLNVVPVMMPSLKQRREDIPELVHHLLSKCSDAGEPVRVTEACLDRLGQLPFPGNVRELENLLQRMLALSEDGVLDVSAIDVVQEEGRSELNLDELRKSNLNLDGWLHWAERRLIEDALAQTEGNVTRAAEQLGVSFRSLRYRLRKLGLKDGDS
ncbi:MAG: sigma-54 dependent transcriptional regulator [Mariprofundaceae bacterium]